MLKLSKCKDGLTNGSLDSECGVSVFDKTFDLYVVADLYDLENNAIDQHIPDITLDTPSNGIVITVKVMEDCSDNVNSIAFDENFDADNIIITI